MSANRAYVNNFRSSDRRLAAGAKATQFLHTSTQPVKLNHAMLNSSSQIPDGSKVETIKDGRKVVKGVVVGENKIKTVQRTGGGKTWNDPSLLEWDPKHFRLFVGNLGSDGSDELLYRAFSPYPSLTKAKVPVDPKTQKNKGFGFVAFSDPDDYLRAFKEMNGKFIGQRPVQLKRAQTEVKGKTKKIRRVK
ncbi:unnamed protein product [Kuraishia capsulata CBS 1993]|uniref:RRM domain-containing protein n=1 Tax=Kuraishia capsulata CBS 1993 TaxID=1382522 RepID=W6MH19_9ASCO|nr:uncharacterized protein KUCA_T00000900001 [Kuraishia capsulata CBS 1993]CDK24933.1 unnamed protein product [Kuraishia capsulata CBS 1993]